MCDDPDVRDPIKFLRQREVVHYQRFGEAMLPDLNGFSLRKPLENHISFTNTQQKTLRKVASLS